MVSFNEVMLKLQRSLMWLQMLNFINHRNDNAAIIPPRELKKLVYGPDSVFARSPTAAQVTGFTIADVADFLHAWERPDGAVFGMAGTCGPVCCLDDPCALKSFTKVPCRDLLHAWGQISRHFFQSSDMWHTVRICDEAFGWVSA